MMNRDCRLATSVRLQRQVISNGVERVVTARWRHCVPAREMLRRRDEMRCN